MRIRLVSLGALACVLGLLTAAHATPGSRIDLTLNPSELANAEHTGAIELTSPAPLPAPSGQYVGPMWLDGTYAKPLHKLPRQMREGMAKPIGPSVTVVQSIHLGAGAGPGMYARF